MTFKDDLGADSLDMFEFSDGIKKMFLAQEISDDDAEKQLFLLGDAVKLHSMEV